MSDDGERDDLPEVVAPIGGQDPEPGAEGPGFGLGPGLDLGSMVQMAQQMGEQVAAAQEQLAAARVEGTAGGGVVRVTLDGHLRLLEVSIDPSAVDPDDAEILGDLVVAAWQDAHDQVARLQAEADPLGGLGGLGGSGGLGGLLGGA